MPREFEPWGVPCLAELSKTKTVYYSMEIRDMKKTFFPPRILAWTENMSVSGFPVVTITRSLAQSATRELRDCQILKTLLNWTEIWGLLWCHIRCPLATMLGFLLPIKITWVFGGCLLSVAEIQK